MEEWKNLVNKTWLHRYTRHNQHAITIRTLDGCFAVVLVVHLTAGNIIPYCIFHADEAEDEDENENEDVQLGPSTK